MATVRKSISFTETLSEWMQRLVASGEYANESEYVRDLVRRDRERNAKLLELKAAVQEGMKSGVGSKTVTQIMTEVEDELKANGHL